MSSNEFDKLTIDKKENNNDGNNKAIPTAMWFTALLIAQQSFSFGYVFSCLNSCLVTGDNNSGSDCYNGSDSTCPDGTIYNDINLTTLEAQMATSVTIAGAWIGCMVISSPSEHYGKRLTLLFNTLFFISGAVLSAIGPIYTLFIGRFISGLGVGISSSIPSVLLSEIATDETRGLITTLHQVMITSGIFIAALVGYGFVTYVDHGWQIVQALGALPSIIMLLLQNFVPESPKWLLKHADGNDPVMKKEGRSNSVVDNLDVLAVEVEEHIEHSHHNSEHQVDAVENPMRETPQEGKSQEQAQAQMENNGRPRVLSQAAAHITYEKVVSILTPLRPPGHDIDEEIANIISVARQEAAEVEDASQVTWEEVMVYKKGLIAGIGLMFFQAMTGINSVTFYSTTIFGLAGFSESIIGTASFGAVNLIATIAASYLIDKMGRKILLLVGTYIMLGALLLLSIILISPVPGTFQGLIAVLAVLIFVTGFALGLGAAVWPVMSELMPTRLRVKAISLFLSVNWGSNLVIGLLTLSAIDGLGGVKSGMDDEEVEDAEKKGVAIMYFLFAGITVLALMFIHAYVPETKGKTPEQIMAMGNAPLLKPLLGADEDDSGSDHAIDSNEGMEAGAVKQEDRVARRRTSKS